MREESKEAPIEVVTERLKLLPRRHRIAHLRALVARQFAEASRIRELAALLHNELMAQAAEEGGPA